LPFFLQLVYILQDVWKIGKWKLGFGFQGVCLNSQDSLSNDVIPEALNTVWEKILQPIIKKSPMNPSLCFGDFSAARLSEMSGTQEATCHKFLLDRQYNGYGTVGISVRNIPCGKPVEVNICAVFDRYGTVGVSLTGGTIACVAAMTTGIGAVISVVAEQVKYVQFGFSYLNIIKVLVWAKKLLH